MKTQVEFNSSAFPKYPDEHTELINSNCWGKRLAEFIRDTLPLYGIQTEDILNEDWGWLVHIQHPAYPVWIGCGVTDQAEDDDERDDEPPSHAGSHLPASVTHFTAFVKAEPGFFKQLFKRVDTAPAVEPIVSAMQRMLAEHAEFQDVEWS